MLQPNSSLVLFRRLFIFAVGGLYLKEMMPFIMSSYFELIENCPIFLESVLSSWFLSEVNFGHCDR